MASFLKVVGVIAIGFALIAGAVAVRFVRRGVSARREPSALESVVARRLRNLAIPADARDAENPVESTSAVLEAARTHWADHCATCHGADGGGNTTIGRNLYPPAPDMRKEQTQSLADGELFYIIRNGVRFTGMPGWGSGDPTDDEESWHLVHFVRRLPDLNEQEIAAIEALMPKGKHAEEAAHEHGGHGGDTYGHDAQPHAHGHGEGGHAH